MSAEQAAAELRQHSPSATAMALALAAVDAQRGIDRGLELIESEPTETSEINGDPEAIDCNALRHLLESLKDFKRAHGLD